MFGGAARTFAVGYLGLACTGALTCRAASTLTGGECAPTANAVNSATASQAYTIKLSSFVPSPNREAGVLLSARINGGPALRLLLDSAAEGVVLDSRSAAKSSLVAGSDFVLVGAGNSATTAATTGTARTIEIGPLSFHGCPVQVVRGSVVEGVDGVVPTALFRDFLIRLDLPGKALHLSPTAAVANVPAEGFIPVMPGRTLLFVKAMLERAHEGYVLLDTGSSYSVVSQEEGRALKAFLTAPSSVRGANGVIDSKLLNARIRFKVGGVELSATSVVALDLTTLSRYNGVEIAGVLGFPELRNSVLTIDYQGAQVLIDAQAR